MDYSKAQFWAISSLGYGKGFSLNEAIVNHDKTISRDYGSMLSVPVTFVPLMVWKPKDENVTGFYLDGSGPHWTVGDEGVGQDSSLEEIIAAREQGESWLGYMAENHPEIEFIVVDN